MNNRRKAEAIAAQIVEAGFSVVIPDEPTDGVWRLRVSGGRSWSATVDVPVAGGLNKLTIESADSEMAAEVEDLVRSLGCESDYPHDIN
jgi:hypothetical protein